MIPNTKDIDTLITAIEDTNNHIKERLSKPSFERNRASFSGVNTKYKNIFISINKDEYSNFENWLISGS